MAWVEAVSGTEPGRRRYRLKNPASLEPVGEFDALGEPEVRAAVERARKAQPGWAALDFDARGKFLERAVTHLIAHQDEFVDVIVRETGKPTVEAFASGIVASCDVLTFYAKRARRILADRTVPVHLVKNKKLRISYRPLGVVGIITPWNFPFLLSLNPTAQALMAGNAVILKPSEVTAFSGQLLADLFEAAGLPEGVFQVVLGDGETGRALCEAGVDKISFTGSVATGRRVGETCGRNLVPCTLELGGKDPMIVCADADLERAANAAVFGAFANSGQACISTERVYVDEDVADEFTRKVVEKTGQLRQGTGGEIDVGCMITPTQLDVVAEHVDDAVARGARVLAGGRRNPGYDGLFYEPTVLVDVDHDMKIMQEETFGPVLPIMRFRDEESAIRLANDTPYGLNASVFTRDKRKGVEMARAICAGAVVVNDCMVTYGVTEAPFGGRKDSGIGQVNGETGLRSYCYAQSILVDRFGGKAEGNWYPHTGRKLGRMRRLVRWMWGTPLGRLLS
ncbi:MAG: aldehyde dehydrogenase family protein [Myxococcales bacterium]|nr:aldehyde dehydrogenase family protein [Myxococcales bacterium]